MFCSLMPRVHVQHTASATVTFTHWCTQAENPVDRRREADSALSSLSTREVCDKVLLCIVLCHGVEGRSPGPACAMRPNGFFTLTPGVSGPGSNLPIASAPRMSWCGPKICLGVQSKVISGRNNDQIKRLVWSSGTTFPPDYSFRPQQRSGCGPEE